MPQKTRRSMTKALSSTRDIQQAIPVAIDVSHALTDDASLPLNLQVVSSTKATTSLAPPVPSLRLS